MCTFDLLWQLLVDVFDRNVPIPVVTRWHTVEMASWGMLDLISFRLIRQLCGDCYISFIPGDPIDSNVLDTEEHKTLCSERMKRIHSHIRTDAFVNSVVTLTVASIPRWSLARCIESEREPSEANEKGTRF